MWGNLLNSLSPRVGGGSVASALVRFRFWSIPPRSTDIPLRALCLPVARTFLSVRRGAVLFLTPSLGSPYCVGGTDWRHGSPCLQGEPVEKNRFPLFKGEPAGGGSPYNRRIFEQPRVRLTPSFRFPKQTVGTKHASQFPLCSRGNHWKVGPPTFHAGWNRRRQCWKRP